jgi:hypothetical protein
MISGFSAESEEPMARAAAAEAHREWLERMTCKEGEAKRVRVSVRRDHMECIWKFSGVHKKGLLMLR